MPISKNSMIGNAGEYYVCAELCKRNILALITPKNNPLFDIVASDPAGERSERGSSLLLTLGRSGSENLRDLALTQVFKGYD